MAACYELESCYPDLNPTLYTKTNLGSLLGKYVKICEGCYLVKQSTIGSCPNEIALPESSYDTCAECYGTIEALCNTCPEYYTQTTLDDGTVVCQFESTYSATFIGDTAPIFPSNRNRAYNRDGGLNLLEDITSAPKPILARTYSTVPSGGPSNGYWNKFGFRDANGNTVFGQTGYSLFSNDATPTTFTGNSILGNPGDNTAGGRLNASGIWFCGTSTTDGAQCSSIQGDYPDETYTPQEFEEGKPPNKCNVGTYVKFTFCFVVPTEKQYTIGYSADNEVRILLDNTPLLVHKGNGQLGTGDDSSWAVWTVLPITLTAGQHTITLIGYNYSGNGIYGAEVYDLTAQELINQFLCPTCTGSSYEPTLTAIPGSVPSCGSNTITNLRITTSILDPYILFSTKTFKDLASNGNALELPITQGTYVCADGSTVNNCSATGVPECNCLATIPFPECCYKLTDCQSSTEIYTNTDLVNYQGQYVNIDGGTECYLVEQLNTGCPDNTQDVQVTQAYSSCDTCVPSYKLFNCKDQNVNLQTANTSFEQYLTKTIKLQEYPNDCWQVGPNPEKSLPLQTLTVTQSFETCAECDPVTYGLTNCVNGVSVLSTADLSNYVGKIIKAENFPGLCFSVTETLCKCLKITINNQPYSINATENNLINGRPYFQFTLQNGDPMTISYSATNNQWEAYNSDTGVLKFYTTMDIDCPATGYWVRDDETFIGNMSTETCPLSILNISPSEEFNSCEPCVNC